MSSATVKRARVAARIAQAENTSLPTSSENTQLLLEQTEAKRKLLDKKCNDYEQICKRTVKLKTEKGRLDTDLANLTAQSNEVDESFGKYEKHSEETFLMQQKRNNEMNQAVQQWTALDGKEEKLYDDLNHETQLEKELRTQCDQVSRNVENLRNEAVANEKEFQSLEIAFDKDMKTEKTLEQYLTRLVDDVFANQRRLEDIHIGTSRGRADFRQAEKALQDQKKRHRHLSLQVSAVTDEDDTDTVFDSARSGEQRKLVDQIEEEWNSVQEMIRKKEHELVEETEKMERKLKKMQEEQNFTAGKEEKQKQLKIAQDYADLQSHTPMYAAYSASLNLNHDLIENLDISESRSSIGKEPMLRSSHESIISRRSVGFSDDLERFSEYSEMMDSRKKILRATENEALRVLTSELKTLEGIVSGQRQEAQALERNVRWARDNIQLRQADIQFYKTKTEELIARARKEDEHKLQSETKSQPLDLSESRRDILELREKHILLENERNVLNNQISESSLECSRLSDQWKILKGFARSVDMDSIRKMDDDMEQWKVKVEQLEKQIAKLQRMEDYASLANGQLRNNLALLKPYDEEYQEFEHLVDANRKLNEQLAKHTFRKHVDELKQNGDIHVFS